MRPKKHIRLFVLTILVSTGLVFISYTHIHTKASPDSNTECTDGEKCSQKKVQTEFFIWESLSRNLFGSNS